MVAKMSCYEGGFRLNDAASECSMKSKARIDSLFEDTKSVCSSTYGDYYSTVCRQSTTGDVTLDEQNRANNAVQARIEAMFASVEAEAGSKGECAAAILPVKYMGAAPVGGRIASVRGLQEPLRQLLECMNSPVSAELEISRRGLTFRTSELIEKTNPFRRIAVWSALKLRCRVSTSENASDEFHHAFIPLIGEEQTPRSDEKHADLYRTMRGLSTDVSCYPPVFAVVMRRPGAARVLECHAFACKTEEDAIAAAATLYRALLADLESNRRRPRQSNGLGCVSLASVASSVVDYTSVISKNTYNNLPPKSVLPHPIRPPRVKKNSTSGSTTDGGSSRSVNVKVPRKKRISEIMPEDVVEARKRQNQLKESKTILKEITDNSTIPVTQERNKESKEKNSINKNEDINNYRNKLHSVNETKDGEKINDENKLSKKNNLYELEKNYSFIEKNGIIIGEVVNAPEVQLYEENQDFHSINENCRRNGNYASQLGALYRSNQDISLLHKVEDNSKYCKIPARDRRPRNNRNKNKSYEDHFRDANKIYSLDQDDTENYEKTRNFLADNVSSNRGNSSCTANRRNSINRNMRHRENCCASQRVSRIDEFSRRQQNSSGINITADHGCQKIRKRDRAGSEPPLSRTENATRTSQDIKLKRSLSDLEVERGDLMTRVELPRRGSFLKPGSTRLPNNIHGGTPLGFTELFDEFRNQEGLTSVDDILDVIIDPEGMSFNELKPLYKEFLLKLASTLTQDELYQRSANIMKRRRCPQRMRSTRKANLLGRAIKRSVSKLKSGPTEFTSVIFPAKKFNESLDSSSSCDMRNSRNRVLASRLSRRKSSWKRPKGLATSEDSDTCKRLTRNAGANRSSSGYVSCSECSYDSESCTCTSADKCYCSLPRKTLEQLTSNNIIVCNCDTDSCSESNKCYCSRRPTSQPTILEQLRQRGIIPSEGSLSTEGSPDRIRGSRNSKSHSSSQSLEFYKMRPSPARSSSDNLALDYDLFNPGKKSQHSKNEKILVVSARDPHGRLVYVGGAERNKKSNYIGAARPTAHHEALSIKKSAEIAAVFGSESARSCKRTSSISSMRSSVSLEAGLGYLP
ncbi:uncharacterized protein [Chelonus insularis]|uniref:uncharacterized protein n=1 Tax=Chelonus insularis TaxID=460826 RepID=UPI00158ADDC1|nr:uncharacterized protein LOC118071195 [Chelonus insularis]